MTDREWLEMAAKNVATAKYQAAYAGSDYLEEIDQLLIVVGSLLWRAAREATT